MQTIVIGAGPSGLGFVYGADRGITILEKEPCVGGLCRSYEVDGAVFDVGGHSFHTPHPEVRDLITQKLDLSLYGQQRKAWVFHHGTLIPYPFQKHYEKLGNADIARECAEGATATGDAGSASNFEEWIVRRFGPGTAKHFMLPYNRKLWARDLTRISTEWVAERVAAPKTESEKFDETGGKRKPLQDDTKVYYPAQGGFAEIYKRLADRLPLAPSLGNEVTKIDPGTNTLEINGGQTSLEWSSLISTMPLPILARTVVGFPNDLREQVNRLEAMSLHVAYLVVSEQLWDDVQRIYSSEDWFPPHKVALNHNSSERLRRRANHAIMAEISFSDEKPVEPIAALNKTVDGLVDMGVISDRRVVKRSWIETVPYAYPVYTHERPRIVKNVKTWLQKRGIYTLGRFGSWEYKNSDACVKEGIELAKTLRAPL